MNGDSSMAIEDFSASIKGGGHDGNFLFISDCKAMYHLLQYFVPPQKFHQQIQIFDEVYMPQLITIYSS